MERENISAPAVRDLSPGDRGVEILRTGGQRLLRISSHRPDHKPVNAPRGSFRGPSGKGERSLMGG